MRILYHHRVASRDGQYVHIERLVQALRRLGAEVEVVGPPVEDAPEGEAPGLFVHARRLLPRPLFELGELAWGLGSSAALLTAARRFRPHVLYQRYGLHDLGGLLAARRLGLPLLLEVNAPLALERARFGGLAFPALARWSERRIWRGADHLFVVSRALHDMALDAGVDPARVEVTPNGVDPEHFARLPDARTAKARLGLVGATVLGFVGYVRPWHGLERVIARLAALERRDVVLLVIGDGPARPTLEAQARALGLGQRVRFLGPVRHEELPPLLAAFDIALQPAVVPWASPLKLLEYMAAGRCILAVDAPNIRELVTHGKTAWLAAPEAWAAALDRLLDDAALRARLGAAARAEIRRRDLTWSHNAARVLQAAEQLVRRRAPRP